MSWIWAKKTRPQKPKILRVKRRVPFYGREKAAYIKLRRLGLSINSIAEAFGRSTSVVWKTVKFNEGLETLRSFDLRKSSHVGRARMASFRRSLLYTLLDEWVLWIEGERDEPP